MTVSRRVTAYILTLLALAISARAQDATLEAQLERVAGVKPSDARTFFGALRRGLGEGNPRDVCALVGYPLRQPSGPIIDAAACENRYNEIFTVGVRRAVGRAQFEELFVTPAGIAVGFGELWFARCQAAACRDSDLRITQVNGADDGALKPPGGKPLLACALAGAGEGRWLTLTADGAGGAELRLWAPEAGLYASTPPATHLRSQPTVAASTPRCAYRTYSFADASTSYTVVSEAACAELDDRIPPMGTVGVVTRAVGGSVPETLWCIQ